MERKIDAAKLYSLYDVAAITQTSYTSVNRWIRSGKLHAIRLQDMFVVRGSDLLATLARAKAGKIKLEAPYASPIRLLVGAK
jgi:predicted site-specific integrase-resolvase